MKKDKPQSQDDKQSSVGSTELLEELAAAHRYVESVAHTADNPDEYGPMWHGWALREAFMKGIEWERSRSSNDPS